MNNATHTAVKPSRYIAKCFACKCMTSGLSAGQDCLRDKNDPQRGGAVYTHANGGLVLDCRQCGKPRYAKRVRGVYSAKHVCNDKCMSSTGTVCECSCGGRNHGGAYSAA
jgi:hypothetical protein